MTCVSFAWKFRSFLPHLDPETGHWRINSLLGLLRWSPWGVTSWSTSPSGMGSPTPLVRVSRWTCSSRGNPCYWKHHCQPLSKSRRHLLRDFSQQDGRIRPFMPSLPPMIFMWTPDSSTMGSLEVIPVKRKEMDCWEGEGGQTCVFWI